MKIGIGKLSIMALGALLIAPVLYSVVIALIEPASDKSHATIAPQASALSGEQLYSKCAPCHGDNGDGSDAYPPLNKLTKERLTEMLVGYQEGSYGGANKRIMQVQVEGMSKADMQKLSDFVTKLKPKEQKANELQEKQKIKKDQQIDITGISS